MIERYSLPEMKNLWELETKFAYYLRVEIAVCEAYNEIGEIPDSALKLYERRETLRKYKLCLDELVSKYTHLRTKLSKDVSALIATELSDIEKLLQKGSTRLLWSDEGEQPRCLILKIL